MGYIDITRILGVGDKVYSKEYGSGKVHGISSNPQNNEYRDYVIVWENGDIGRYGKCDNVIKNLEITELRPTIFNMCMNAPQSGATIQMGEFPVCYSTVEEPKDNEVTLKITLDSLDFHSIREENEKWVERNVPDIKDRGKGMGIIKESDIVKVYIYDCSIIRNVEVIQ